MNLNSISHMPFQTIHPEFISQLQKAVGIDNVFLDAETLDKHASDQTKNCYFLPEVVVKPRNTKGVAQVMAVCFENNIPVTVQGALSGLSGAALPVHGGVALSMLHFDKILHIDERNFQVTVEPGVITEHLQNVLKEKNLFYPPDPAGRGWSSIGGNVATNAGGPRCVKYGVTRDYVLNLEVVLPNGETLWTGANTLKFSTGYNLTHLFIGSEGTLGVITKIVLKLLPYPNFNLLLLVPFFEAEDACKAVNAILQAGVMPSCLEFMERNAIDYAIRYCGEASFPIKDNHQAHLLIELDGNDMNVLQNDCEKIAEVVSHLNADDILFADSESIKNELWKLRRNVSNAVTTLSQQKIAEDTVVPRAEVPILLRGVKKICEDNDVLSVCWGHLGDGNLHVNIITESTTDDDWHERAIKSKMEIFKLVKSLGGMLSAEHGVGYTQKDFMPLFFNPPHLSILRGIKSVFDTKGILNPGKVMGNG